MAIGLLASGGVNAAAFPDTATCITTPTISFPATVTVDGQHLLTTTCPTPDMNEGDFVSIIVKDFGGFSVIALADYVETDSGIEWAAPLSDSNGTAWYLLNLSHDVFDCNESGGRYQINVNWDGKKKSQNFDLMCPTITFTKYITEVNFWNEYIIEATVEDNRGYRMHDIECEAEVVRGLDGDYNIIEIVHSFPTTYTDTSGHIEFNMPTGLFSQ